MNMYPYEVRITKTKIQSMPVYTRGSLSISFHEIYLVYIRKRKTKKKTKTKGFWEVE